MKLRTQSCVAALILAVCILPALAGTTFAQEQPLRSITYRLGMSRPGLTLVRSNESRVELPDPLPKSVDFQMAKWSPRAVRSLRFCQECPGI